MQSILQVYEHDVSYGTQILPVSANQRKQFRLSQFMP